jgi:hypothetical protein
MTLNTSRKLFHGSVKDIHASNKATKKKNTEKFISCQAHTPQERQVSMASPILGIW